MILSRILFTFPIFLSPGWEAGAVKGLPNWPLHLFVSLAFHLVSCLFAADGFFADTIWGVVVVLGNRKEDCVAWIYSPIVPACSQS